MLIDVHSKAYLKLLMDTQVEDALVVSPQFIWHKFISNFIYKRDAINMNHHLTYVEVLIGDFARRVDGLIGLVGLLLPIFKVIKELEKRVCAKS